MARWFFKTQEEIAAERRNKISKRLDKEIREECKYYAELIPQVVANCGINHFLPMSDRPTVVQANLFGWKPDHRIEIVETRYNEYAIYLWIDTRKLPWNTRLPYLYDPGVLETLSDACGRVVTWRSEPGKGSWYVVWREGARNAIPIRFKFSEVLDSIPASAPPLYYIPGITENNRLLDIDIAILPHMLIGGSTFTGKSVHLNQMLCQLIMRNTPEQLRLTMIDLKDGSEFRFYDDLPHLAMPIIARPEDVPDALRAFNAEMQRRREMFPKGVKDIKGWNAQFKNDKLSYWLLVFDELAQVMAHPNRALAKESAELLSSIMSTARSAGGHVIICTQSPRTDIIPPWIKNNANARICFSVPSNTDSIVVIDNGIASKLDPDIPGRAILSKGPHIYEFQTPFISNEQITEIVKQAKAGASAIERAPLPPGLAEVLEMAIDNYGGKLNANKIAESFKGTSLGRNKVRELIRSLNGGPIFVRGIEYRRVNPGHGRHGGAYLEPVEPIAPEITPDETERPERIDSPRYTPRVTREFLRGTSQSQRAPTPERMAQLDK